MHGLAVAPLGHVLDAPGRDELLERDELLALGVFKMSEKMSEVSRCDSSTVLQHICR